MVGSRWFAFVVSSVGENVQGELLCFDISTAAACVGQPFPIDTGPTSFAQIGGTPAAIGDNIFVSLGTEAGNLVACFDGATLADCAGSWPAAVSVQGPPIPTLTSGGVLAGLCVASEPVECLTFAGAAAATPPGLDDAIDASFAFYNSQAVVIGARVYIPSGLQNAVDCYNFLTGAACVGFPKVFTDLGLLYSVNADPFRPTCLWVNSDTGVQIQNFDAFGGDGCGEGPIRVLASNIVPPNPVCVPVSYLSLAILSPLRADYTTGTVAILDADGNPIPGIPPQPIRRDRCGRPLQLCSQCRPPAVPHHPRGWRWNTI